MTNPDKLPNPGSDEALKLGCACPAVDNCHGRGYHTGKNGEPCFVYNLTCPIHGEVAKLILGAGHETTHIS